MSDMINHPPHYCHGKIEAIDVIEDWKLDYHMGNMLKYLARAGRKDNELQDLQKLEWYVKRKIALVEKRQLEVECAGRQGMCQQIVP